MKRVLLLLAVGALALPAFANSIPFYGSHAGGRYMSGGTTTWMAEHSTGNPVWGTFDGWGAVSAGGALAFNVTEWTNSSTNNIVDYTGRSRSAYRLSGVHTQRLNPINGSTINGHIHTNGRMLANENGRAAVPEPETLGLLGTGLFVIGGLMRRKIKMRELLRSSHNL